jgi:hypothetical protein
LKINSLLKKGLIFHTFPKAPSLGFYDGRDDGQTELGYRKKPFAHHPVVKSFAFQSDFYMDYRLMDFVAIFS